MTLPPEQLAAAWYVEQPSEGWWVGHGDLFAAAPYPVRDPLGFARHEPVLAVCAEHPCDTANEPRPPRVRFVRAWYLDELLALRPKLWEALPQVAQGTHLDFWLLPPWPGRWEEDILIDFRDQFSAFAEDVRTEDRLGLLRDEVRPAFVWRLLLRDGRVNPPHPVAPFSKLRMIDTADEPAVVRPSTIAPRLLELPLRVDEVALEVRRADLMLTHWQRAGQDWWRAEWRGLKAGYGYGRTIETATENLVREVRRLAYRLPSLLPERANDLRAQFRAAGVKPLTEGTSYEML